MTTSTTANELAFTAGESAIFTKTGETVTINGVKGRWVSIYGAYGKYSSINVARADLSAVPPKAAPALIGGFTVAELAKLADIGPVDFTEKDENGDGPTDENAYTGPMLALRERAKQGLYQKAANGQPSCGDEVAQILGALKPEQVIAACIAAMALPGNPYTHLNIGQQSMNLRNKLRGALKRGEFGMGVVREAAEDAAQE